MVIVLFKIITLYQEHQSHVDPFPSSPVKFIPRPSTSFGEILSPSNQKPKMNRKRRRKKKNRWQGDK
jgi:hypothetical protein